MELWNLVETFLGKKRVESLVPGKLLAVDDDEGNLVVLEELLMDDYDLTVTTSPHEALELIKSQEFDMVISDQRMPDITGVELLHEVRQRYPNTVRIIVSAYSDAKAMLQAINVGEVYRFILKPWDQDEVTAIVKQGLEYRLSLLVIRKLVETLHHRNRQLDSTVTELKETQGKLVHSARLATVGQLTSSIVRELKNHVTGVQVLKEAIEEAEVPEELTEYVRVGAYSAQALFDLIGGLNAFAGQGSWKLKKARCSFNRLVEEAMGIVRLDTRIETVKLSLVPDHGLPFAVIDCEKIRQVVVNLVLNALDASAKGGKIEVSTKAVGTAIELMVRDSGAGIPKEMLERIQNPFVSTRKDALGLGLMVCRQVVEAHGGSMAIDSREGTGTVVRVRIPSEPAAMK